ncbi:peptidoglycan-binding domain-containing protein [Calidifontibacter indicus]|uniref:peptidoglycan-binding domain-containing protein n=1 Tax=Calidifontibacter indicus TaxID=419650 RepID=UPI003D72B05C
MATTAAQAIAWHDKFLGKRDNGGSFIWQKVIPRFGFAPWYDGLAYCGATQLALAADLGLDTFPMKDPKRLVYVPYVVQDAKAAGKWRRASELKPGDWCINDWRPADGAGDHITMVISNDPARRKITVVGGNHRDGKTNGARGVFVRTWDYADVMGGVDRQHAYAATTGADTGGKVSTAFPVLTKGSTGDSVRKLQSWLLAMYPSYAKPAGTNGKPDGSFGAGMERVVKEWQRRSGLTPDGAFGPKSLEVARKQGFKP